MHDPAVQHDHVVKRTQVQERIESVQVAEQEAGGVADAPVGVAAALEDLVADRHLVAVVGRGHPQAQHVGAHRIHHLLRGDHVAQRLGHLAAVLVHREAMGQHLPVRGHPVHGNAG